MGLHDADMKTRLLFLACLLLASLQSPLAAQERKLQNKPFIDERRFHYGFFVGLADQGLKLRNNGFIQPGTGRQWMAENDSQNFGFSVGILGDLRLGRYVSLRALPQLQFGSKHLSFRDLSTGERQSQDMKSTYIGLPIDLKVAAPRFNNYRPYVMLGLAPFYDLTTSKHSLLRTKALNTCLEVGLGCEIYLPFFKLVPELKFDFGLGNVLDKQRPELTDPAQRIFTESIDAAHLNMVSLVFYFE